MSDKYYKEQFERPLDKAPRNIAIVDSSFANEKEGKFVMEVAGSKFKPEYIISDTEGIELCKFQYNYPSIYMLDDDNNTVLNIKFSFLSDSIYKGNDTKERLAKIKSKLFSSKYVGFNIECKNLATNENELIQFNCDHYYRSGGLFLGKESQGGLLVAKVTKLNRESYIESVKYLIEIASGVDKAFALTLAVYLAQQSIGQDDIEYLN